MKEAKAEVKKVKTYAKGAIQAALLMCRKKK
jgi:hypothetical protein